MFENGRTFEDEVRRIARLLWPEAAYGGAAIEEGRERDGIFVTDECVHLIECTTLPTKQKAFDDTKKIVSLAARMKSRHPTRAIKGWFITLNEPTADQRSVMPKDGTVVAISFDQFRSKLIDSRTYLDNRKTYSFGSMRNLDTGSNPGIDFKYIPLDILSSDGQKWTIGDISYGALTGQRWCLLGDYGAGKSTSMREIFLDLEKKYKRREATKFPILLNLRDHHGQTSPAEALERHARNVGYSSQSHLVRAWLAGFVVLLLDGFDEMATAGWSGQAKKLRDIRYRSMQLIREFIRNTPSDTGVVISGRQHFFDSNKELRAALGTNEQFIEVNLNDFDDKQVQAYLSHHGMGENIPLWLPSRPLLLGYLASKRILHSINQGSSPVTPAFGWDMLLTKVCEREADIEAGIDGETVRNLIERLATIARRSSDGLGPLQSNEIVNTFQEVCGYSPDDRGIVLLQRLPGLGPSKQEDGSRDFIDSDFVDAARAGDVVSFIENPYGYNLENIDDWQVALNQLGREIASNRCKSEKFTGAKVAAAIHSIRNSGNRDVLSADIIHILKEMGLNYSDDPVYVRDVIIQESAFGDEGDDFSGVRFENCLFNELELGLDAQPAQLPKFVGCYFALINGRTSAEDLPADVFDEKCVFDDFGDKVDTSSSILSLQLSLGVRVLLITLKKLYLQRGTGRKDSALYRGMDHRAKRLVPDILHLLQQEGLAIRSTAGTEIVWLPMRSSSVRVKKILSSPRTSDDPLIFKASSIS